ncbi:MAG: hypothetical protein MRY64_03130 [Hyphomonadaceae bacterium]|nr:hypothetical protein [Hyphomonadaceae bacterium]
MFRQALLTSLAGLSISACGAPQTSIAADSPGADILDCEDYASVPTETGILYNNVWNKHAAGDQPFRQCLIQETGGQLRMGWLWDWPSRPRAVFGQPQIKIGASPWAPEPAFGTDLPAQLSRLNTLNLRHRVSIYSDGNYNLVTTLWLGDGPVPTQNAIRAEVMIWTLATPGQFNPGGRRIGQVESGGETWQVWLEPEWTDPSGIHDTRWTYLAFQREATSPEAEIDVHALLQHGIRQGYLSEDWYAYDLELGMEVMGGQGRAFVDHFEIEID